MISNQKLMIDVDLHQDFSQDLWKMALKMWHHEILGNQNLKESYDIFTSGYIYFMRKSDLCVVRKHLHRGEISDHFPTSNCQFLFIWGGGGMSLRVVFKGLGV